MAQPRLVPPQQLGGRLGQRRWAWLAQGRSPQLTPVRRRGVRDGLAAARYRRAPLAAPVGSEGTPSTGAIAAVLAVCSDPTGAARGAPGARADSARPPAIPHASAAYGGQLWRAALSQPSPTALPQAAAKLLGRPEAGLGHSEPDKRAGNHLSPVAEVGLLRPPRRPQGGCPRPSLASALCLWRGNLGHGSLGPTTRELVDSWGPWGGQLHGSMGVREAQTMRQCPPLDHILGRPRLASSPATKRFHGSG